MRPEWQSDIFLPHAGVGRALAEAFLEAGDNVCVCSRSDARVSETVKALQAVGKQRPSYGNVKGTSANVAKPADVERLAKFARHSFGSVDLWINNAGSNGYRWGRILHTGATSVASLVTSRCYWCNTTDATLFVDTECDLVLCTATCRWRKTMCRT